MSYIQKAMGKPHYWEADVHFYMIHIHTKLGIWARRKHMLPTRYFVSKDAQP